MVHVPEITAWRPRIEGIHEVFHARFTDHAYPPHTHDAWTLLIVDSGAISYELNGREHGSVEHWVTLLPPHVPHDGRAAGPAGFRKRVLYIEDTRLSGIGPAVDTPSTRDPILRDRIHRLHQTLRYPGDELEAESRLTFVLERLQSRLRRRRPPPPPHRDPSLARDLRALLDEHSVAGITLAQAGRILYADPAHLVRAFSREFGIAPHRYLIGRRIDLARRLLLEGRRPAEVAVAAGFHDQSHLNRHFKRMIGATPKQFASSYPARTPPPITRR
ncbi:AraC family transcriptional regulator [Nocardia rhamnosiphila]